MILALITITVILILYGAVSKPLDARGITSAMIFTAAGLAVGTSALNLVNIRIESKAAETFVELALVFLLFSDSTRIDLAGLRRHLSWPSRLLLIGLPLTIVAGLGAGVLVFPGIALANAFVLSTMLCSTDAALAQTIVSNTSVPTRVRQALDVESGLNDGLGVPFFLVAVDLSLARLTRSGVTSAVVSNMAEQIGWGLVAGVGAGTLAGLLLRASDARGWLEGQWRQILPLVAALLAYLIALKLGGSGFIGAFVGGMTFGYLSRRHDLPVTSLDEGVGGTLAGATWVGFGALAVGMLLPHVTWQVLAYSALSLAVVRMVPVGSRCGEPGRDSRPSRSWDGSVRAVWPRSCLPRSRWTRASPTDSCCSPR
jgi:sodium/hydrogen antiporter